MKMALWQGRQDSNPRPTVLETAALPTELRPYLLLSIAAVRFGPTGSCEAGYG
jgi:hypothetical protein